MSELPSIRAVNDGVFDEQHPFYEVIRAAQEATKMKAGFLPESTSRIKDVVPLWAVSFSDKVKACLEAAKHHPLFDQDELIRLKESPQEGLPIHQSYLYKTLVRMVLFRYMGIDSQDFVQEDSKHQISPHDGIINALNFYEALKDPQNFPFMGRLENLIQCPQISKASNLWYLNLGPEQREDDGLFTQSDVLINTVAGIHDVAGLIRGEAF